MTPIPPDPEGNPSIGGYVRMAIGALCILAAVAIVVIGDLDKADPLTTRDLVQDGLLLVTGALLISPQHFIEFVGAIKDRIPGMKS